MRPGGLSTDETARDGFAAAYTLAGSTYTQHYDKKLSRKAISNDSGGDIQYGGYAIAVDNNDNAFVTGVGSDSVTTGWEVWELNPTNGGFVVTPRVESAAVGFSDIGTGICVTVVNNTDYIYVTGSVGNSGVQSPSNPYGFPLTSNAVQGSWPGDSVASFAVEMNSSWGILYGTYVGGANGADTSNAIAVDSSGNITVAGSTTSTRITTVNPLQSSFATDANSDGFVAQISGSNLSTYNYYTYWGGAGPFYNPATGATGPADQSVQAVAVDPSGHVYIAGFTDSDAFPTQSPTQSTNPGFQNAFISEFA
jgi:hypothetical protein